MPENKTTRPPTLDAIRTLVAFADAECSVSAAARALGSQQPVVSTKLKVFQSEAGTGAILLERNSASRGLRLTDAGHGALPVMRQLIQQYDQLLEHLKGAADYSVLLRLAVGAFSAEHFVPPALAELRRLDSSETPFTVKTHVVRGRDRIVGVATGIFDLGVVSHSREQIRSALRDECIELPLTITSLASLPLVVAARKRSAEGKVLARTPVLETVSLSSLAQFELAGPDARSGVRQQLERAAGQKMPLTFSQEGGGWSAAREFARHGLGMAIIPQACLARTDQNDLVVRPLDRKFRLQHLLIQRTRKPLLAEYSLLTTALVSAAKTCGSD